MKIIHSILAGAILLLVVFPACGAKEEPSGTGDYTLLWWADGPPYFLGSKTPAPGNVLCFQSGSWGMAFDASKVRLLRLGRLTTTMDEAMKPGRASLPGLPALDWECALIVDGKKYLCTGHMQVQDEFFQPVRIVESGCFFQRVIIEGLKFAVDGKELPCDARLEISAWPDRLAFRLEVDAGITNGQVMLKLGDRTASMLLHGKTALQLDAFESGLAQQAIVEADPALKVERDASLGCHTLALPAKPWSNAKGTYYPEEHLDRLDRWPVTLRNDTEKEAVARLMFTQRDHLPITGFTSMLCELDGSPSGLPVQISKNWHVRPQKGVIPHQGPWFHGCAFIRVPPKSRRDLVFQMVYARYGGVFAASHAQLSLVGWGHNQFWDQTAIGSFGESICFEPGRVQRRCFIDDVRPLMTLPQGKTAKPWGWADNCGGGDFLMWQDAQYQPMRATRTAYRAYGPCLTRVTYAEESMNGELAARMDVSLPRSEDHLRVFFHVRYDVFKPIQWRRLAFFQLGSDFYNDTPARRVALGDARGMREEWAPLKARDVYDRVAVPLTGVQPWVSIHGVEQGALRQGSAAASRGLIVRSWQAVLSGKRVTQPHASFFATEWGKGNYRTTVELAPPSGVTQLIPGDFVEADMELVVFPTDATNYYGPDKVFQQALAKSSDSWQMVLREAAGNNLNVVSRQGTVVKSYPVVVSVDERQQAEIVVQGGLGYVPFTFKGLSSPSGYALYVDGRPLNQAVHGNDFWQTDYDTDIQKWQWTFNIPLKGSNVVRFGRK